MSWSFLGKRFYLRNWTNFAITTLEHAFLSFHHFLGRGLMVLLSEPYVGDLVLSHIGFFVLHSNDAPNL